MALITLRQLLDHAAEHGYGVPAFNINNMEQGLAIVKAAAEVDAPVILQASRGARSYAGDIMLRRMVEALAEMNPTIPICLHQDHGNNLATCMSAIRHGFTSVMMDGSLHEDMKTPADYDYNVAVTAKVAEAAHAVGASVEGELGVLGSLETGEAAAEDGSGAEGKLDHSQLLTDPDQAVDFVSRTRCDALAIACGTSHGAYKFSRKPDGDILAMHVIEAIHERLPGTHLVMHGSSSVPQYLQDLINDAGGAMPQTYGVPVEEIERGIRHGVRKVNIDTDCRMAMTGQFRKIARDKPEEFDPRKFMIPAMKELTALCRDRFERFGTAGHASKIRVIPMDEMAKRYASGALDPAITGAKAA
ncbi:fructose-bisphosphate aldolase class II [Paracoccus versutus]|jgi:fructose-bisphosphate aldolase class II|uniref:Fructose-1,6-bisphosphate aldolase n=1 Tax=Paracoccus versutus TaxID=34007 RepID=A0A099FF18_PARVE|nr:MULTISPECIES: class II fructose-bisphosphate aldolase [Paracoccus]WGR59450.1 fructose-bisphosphate aldolase class II [Paracoccus ferrooxidans]SFY32362.1 fructose-bisphosphate aldolase [Paracoccus pantotrophus]KGJ08818.1 fructose-1,6-bisphosphate aldolase [Paracoccus versutus]MBT0778659.1 fructose-bisphosphate aldolase class II [Paracoccus sp. pheM1]MDF3905955.1 fructose-bisphosphate aldolase class II [Paracoccus sp. AS002]